MFLLYDIMFRICRSYIIISIASITCSVSLLVVDKYIILYIMT